MFTRSLTLPETEYHNDDNFTFMLVITNKNLELEARIISCLLTFSFTTLFSVLFAVLCSFLYFKWSHLLSNFCEDIVGIQFQVPRRMEVMNMLQRHILLYRMTHGVEKGISATAFMVLCSKNAKHVRSPSTFFRSWWKIGHCFCNLGTHSFSDNN